MSKIDIEKLKKEIVERLKPLEPDKIILFGSYAYGEPNEESDIDLYIVTKDEYIPRNFKEKNELYLKIARLLRDLRKDIPIDIIVHTKKMHEEFVKQNSSFYKYEIRRGIRL
ncbi:nucleotidyltransferase domain-containing protein [Nitratiruptor tergarcus]|uniref:Nucleotidyltransferase domain-containing protein n=1 Tax=Nitratiruptor tergarcus DSM 16512 TaxID=1069081 RepID=A0A1W1WTW9_9BACT|nr:nucleotidyltransferase domain-containing protein [Nitratiruptor tergarcus]SMC09490.1 Nucleotidyltransferase domain-containing protein [Nitratiruptor tergarcus DSM 16512]